jgi:hypothetical protein
MCINKNLEADIHDRGVAWIPTIAEAVAEQKAVLAHLDHLIDTITPAIGQPMAISLSDAATGVLAASDREVMARLAVVMEAVLGGGRGQVLLTPRPEENDE